MIITDRQIIYDRMRDNNLKNYSLIDPTTSNLVDYYEANSESDVDTTIALLDRMLDTMHGLVRIQLSDKSRAEKTQGGHNKNVTFQYRCNGNAPVQTSNNNTPVNIGTPAGYISKEMHELLMAKKDWEHEKAIKGLEEQYKAEETDPIVQQGIDILAQLIKNNPIPGAQQRGPGIAGPGDDKRTRLINAMNELVQLDTNFVEHLEMLLHLRKTKPLIYTIAIEKLKGEVG